MRHALFTLLLIFVLSQSYAQNGNIQGVIFEAGTSIRVPRADISNSSHQITSRTDGMGVFLIPASIGDTLKISKEGFSDQSIVVSSLKDMAIHLLKPIRLNQVTITGQSKKQELDEIKREYRRKGSYHAGKPPLLSYVFTPLTAIYELIGKTPGQARRFNQFYSRELQDTEIDRRFNASTVKPLTLYEGKDLQNFLETYRPAFSELSGWADYDLVKYIRESATAFEAAGKPAPEALPKLPKAPDLSKGVVIKY